MHWNTSSDRRSSDIRVTLLLPEPLPPRGAPGELHGCNARGLKYATYLKEEVQAEALTRNLEGFARFLHVAGAWSGTFLDLAKMAAAAQVPRQTTVRHFEILEDCLIAQRCEPFARSTRPGWCNIRATSFTPSRSRRRGPSPRPIPAASRGFADYHGKRHHAWVFYLGSQPKVVGTARVVPWQQGLKEIGL